MKIQDIGIAARQASLTLGLASTVEKNQALQCMANAIRNQIQEILKANDEDMQIATQKQMPASFLDRLRLDKNRIHAMANSLDDIANLPDPIGTILASNARPNGLRIERVRVPIGVIAVIYESRPNVTADAAGLCLKSGNAVILRGGSESFHSSCAIVNALHDGIRQTSLPVTSVQMVPTADRAAIDELLQLDKYIDVIIPRGGMNLIDYISTHTRIPLFKHLAGNCHTYIHADADLQMAKNIVHNAKLRRTGICGATETLLIDQAIVKSHLPVILQDLLSSGCEIRGDEQTMQLNSAVKPVSEKDYDTEFLDAILAIKVVADVDEAIAHIAKHGTQHTEAIITANNHVAEKFLNAVDSAIVMHNTSTQFADGGEFGMGAEIGIATGKLHARGPVGIEQLTTFKYKVHGEGQIRG